MEMPVTSVTGNDGFTLLELLVVLAIMVLLAGAWPFAAPRLFPAQQLRNEGQSMVGALRSARMTARISGAPQALEFTDAGDAYQVGADAHKLAGGIIARVRNQDDLGLATRVIFYPDGSSSGGVVDLALPQRSVSIEVGRLTGRAELIE
jgi:general secretion pathway protein H